MVRKTLIIGDIVDLQDGTLVLAVDFSDFEVRKYFSELDLDSVINEFTGKKISIVGDNVDFRTSVLDVESSSSLANFKNIFLRIKKSSKSQNIAKLDEVLINIGLPI